MKALVEPRPTTRYPLFFACCTSGIAATALPSSLLDSEDVNVNNACMTYDLPVLNVY